MDLPPGSATGPGVGGHDGRAARARSRVGRCRLRSAGCPPTSSAPSPRWSSTVRTVACGHSSDEEELARALLGSFDPRQRGRAVGSDVPPDDILTRADPVADPSVLLGGLTYAEMSGEQRGLLRRLVRCYLDRAPLPYAERSWNDAVTAGLETVRFGWAGPEERGLGHYYAVRGPTFRAEYDNTQDDANHIHSVWRDLRHDWGEDLLAAHYTHHPH